MKTYFKILILVAVLLFGMVLNVFAAEDSVVLTTSTAKVKVGDTFTVGINVKSTTSFEGLTGILEYNKTKLELVSVANGTGMNNMNEEDASGNYVVTVFSNSSTDATSATCQTLTFKVLDGVTEGEDLVISLSGIQFAEDGKEAAEDLVASTSVKVPISESEPTEPKPTEPEPTEEKTTETKPTEEKSTEEKPAETKPTQNNIKETDKTVKTESLPKTGSGITVYISLIMVTVIAIVSYIISKKYKKI